MAPVKFGLFKTRSREQAEQPSTENLLSNQSFENVQMPSSPESVTKAIEDLAPDIVSLQLEGDNDDENRVAAIRRLSEGSRMDDTQMNYQPLKNQPSIDGTSTSTLHEDYELQERDDTSLRYDDDGASTSCDALSLQMDASSIAPSEDMSVYCGTMKRLKKNRNKEQQLIRDFDMWQASNVEVMQNLLSRSGTLDDQYKWEAIATARGLCTLTDSCACGDCARAKYLAGVTDGDGGLGAAPLINAINVGCCVQ